jgi:glycerol kinase
MCAELKAAGHEPVLRARTGLVLDPYFSATKIRWMLDNVGGLRAAPRRASWRSDRRQLPDLAAVGRQDARHRRHQRVAHAALRHRARRFDPELCALFGVPPSMLPEVCRPRGASPRRTACPGCPTAFPSRASRAISRRRCSAGLHRTRATRSARSGRARSC